MMKKVICLASTLMMILMGCSGTSESWPKEIKGEKYTVTRIDTPYDVSVYTSLSSYNYLTEEEIVQDACLIVKVEIIEEPVEYKIDYKVEKGPEVHFSLNATMRAFQGNVITIYYSEADIKTGDRIKFLREEFWGEDDARTAPKEVLNLKKGETYILFIDNFDDYIYDGENIRYKYAACKEITPYYSSDVCRGIIECKEGNMYYFDQAFSSLASAATMSSIDKGMVWYQKQDDNFDEDIQVMVNQYK